MRLSRTRDDGFLPYTAEVTSVETVALILLLGLAVFLRLHRLAEVPPGIHDDEIINAEIANRLRAGAPLSAFYEAGTGKRETLYYLLLAASRGLTARVPYWFRLPSVVCSLLTIALVYRLSRRWFGPWTALVAAGGLSVAFWPVHLGREALRSGMVPLLGAGMTLALWRGLERPVRDRRAVGWFALAGFLFGLLQYTYPAARVLPLFVTLFIVYLALFHRSLLRIHWRGLGVFLVIGALVAAPAVIYIATHWEQQHRIMTLKGPLEACLAGDPLPVLSSTVKTLGMFVWRGDPQPHYNLPGRPVFEPVGGTLFLVGVLIALVNLRQPAHAYCLLWTVVLLVPGMLTHPAPHFSRAAGALVTTFIFPGLAVRWGAERLVFRGRIGLGIALGLLLGANAGLTYRDYLHRWPTVSGVRGFRHAALADVARYLDRTPDATPIAACTPFLNEKHFFWRTDRQALPYLLNRHDVSIGWYSCLEAQLFPQGGRESRYLFGRDLDFAPFVPSDWAEQAETVVASSGHRLVRLETADSLEAWLEQFDCPDAPSLVFGETMRLVGYQIEPTAPAPGDVLEVLTAWRVLGEPPPRDLSIFLHLLDGSGKLIAQGDALAALSDTFRPDDVFVQRHTVTLAPDVSPGEYRLMTGLYVRDGGRLSLDSGDDDVLVLDVVRIDDVSD